MHVTFRVRHEVPALRNKRLIRDFRRSLSKACERGNFRVVQYSIQRNHVHLIVEAKGKKALASGMKSVHRVQAGLAVPPVKLDEASSGRWFEGWKRPPPAREAPGLHDVAPARTWLLTKGWRSYGLIEPSEVPGAA